MRVGGGLMFNHRPFPHPPSEFVPYPFPSSTSEIHLFSSIRSESGFSPPFVVFPHLLARLFPYPFRCRYSVLSREVVMTFLSKIFLVLSMRIIVLYTI